MIRSLFQLTFFLLAGIGQFAHAQSVTIKVTGLNAPEGFFYHKEKTMVVEMNVEKPKLILIQLPGGNGALGINKFDGRPPRVVSKDEFKSELKGNFSDIFRLMVDPNRNNLPINVLTVDSPYPLEELKNQVGFGFPKDRDASEHQDRLLTVLDHYKNLGLPIWLIGHSNGTFSATRFMSTLKAMNRENDIAGLILSSSRDVILAEKIPNIPTLFVHSDQDRCWTTPYAKAHQNFLETKTRNKSATEFIQIKTGKEQQGDPCYTGIHMHNEAYEEVSQVLTDFLKRNAGL
jgi:hypothetical protein